MTENERRILLLFEKTLPQMTEQEQERLLLTTEKHLKLFRQRFAAKSEPSGE